MAEIIIKKKVPLDFLGDDYKDDYLVFKSISLRTYEEITPNIKEAEKDNSKSMKLMSDTLSKNFLEGKFGGNDVSVDDLVDFDIETLITCFQILTGQALPKVESQSTPPSSITQSGQ